MACVGRIATGRRRPWATPIGFRNRSNDAVPVGRVPMGAERIPGDVWRRTGLSVDRYCRSQLIEAVAIFVDDFSGTSAMAAIIAKKYRTKNAIASIGARSAGNSCRDGVCQREEGCKRSGNLIVGVSCCWTGHPWMPLTAARSASTVAQRTSSEFITRNGSVGHQKWKHWTVGARSRGMPRSR